MKRTIPILAVIAALQIALIVMTWADGSDLKEHRSGSRLLNFDTAAVDTLLIKDADNEIKLVKQDDKWLLDDGFAADRKKVKALFEKLTKLQYGMPVATSAQALKRFKVAEDGFDRFLQLQGNGKKLAELYLGTGAGARQSHVRNGEQKSVYSAAIAGYDLPVTLDFWQDREILQFDQADVVAMELDAVKLQREKIPEKKEKKPLWQAESLPQGKKLNQQAANEVLAKLASLRFDKLLGREKKSEYGLAEPLLTVKLFFTDGDRTYSFGSITDSEDISLKASDMDEYFQLTSSLAQPLLEQLKKIIFETAVDQEEAEIQ